ncbi:hypothetical protein [Nocardia speluncae]|nr:hypothetical protein [Nocardia speluncae]
MIDADQVRVAFRLVGRAAEEIRPYREVSVEVPSAAVRWRQFR